MPIEAGMQNESEKKKKKLSEKELMESDKKILEHQKVKEKISVEIEADEELDHLKDLVDKGLISKETAEKVIQGVDIDNDTINEIFEKINQMDELKDIDNYLPTELRISKEDYTHAINDDIFRVQIITKLESALTLLANQIVPDSSTGINLFSGFLSVLDKNLVLLQENHIDIKDSLQEIENKRVGKKEDNRSLWKRITQFLKEVFTK